MKTLLLLPLGVALVGLGVAAGSVLGPAGGDEGAGADVEILVQGAAGDVQVLTAEEAAARIEQLESLVQRRERRQQVRAAIDVGDDPAAVATAGDGVDGAEPDPVLQHPDGRPYTPAELRDLARTAEDGELRAAAIRALRRDDSPAARALLHEILGDPEVPPELRLVAAQTLARPPHRDAEPEALLALLGEEEDPAIRLALMRGIATLRDRGAYMKEISALLHEETDPAVRAGLLGAVARAGRDPAARQELLHIATAVDARPEERYTALRALRTGRPDADAVAALTALLAEDDPEIRAGALRVLAGDRGMQLQTLAAGLRDQDAGVRIVALSDAMRHVGRLGRAEDADRGAIRDVQRSAANLARSDPDVEVRRAALNAAGNLPRALRDEVIAAARDDPDAFVRLTAYAWSGRETALTATQDYLGALTSNDPRLRDFAYRQLQRLHGVREPFRSGWNARARAEAVEAIRREVAASPVR